MLASRTVCARCRYRLLASVGNVGTARPKSTTSVQSVTAEHEHALQPQQAYVSYANPRTNNRNQNSRGSKKSSKRRALELFESAIRKSEERAAAPETTQDVLKLCQLASQINCNIFDVQAAVACYTFLVTKAVPAVRAARCPLPQVLRAKVSQALIRITEIKLAAIHAPELPKISDICKVHADMGAITTQFRLDLINRFLAAILSNHPNESSAEENFRVEKQLLDDVVEFWKHFSGLRHTNSGLGYHAKFWLTSKPDLKAIENPTKLFGMLFQSSSVNEMQGLVPALVTTYVLLYEPAHEQTKAKEEARAALEALDPIVKRFDRKKLQPLFEGHSELWKYVEPRVNWKVIQTSPAALNGASIRSTVSSHPRLGQFSYAQWHKRFNIAYRGNDHAAVQQTWRNLINPANHDSRTEKLRECPELFDYILHISCHKSRFDETIYTKMISDVSHYMKKIGIKPTTRTYTSMMEGWKLAKRIEPIEHLWHSIIKAGVKLDNNIWSCRISALGSLGKPWDGIRALTHMERAWQQAVQEGTPGAAVKPGIASVNAAIAGLLWRDRMEAVKKVLEWASERGLEPDIYTYNMLLSRMLKRGSAEEADRILHSMQTAGIRPDGATFTIIIETALLNLWQKSPEEQRAAVDSVFAEMAACGVEPNQETYAKMLHTLTNDGEIARSCVDAVLAHMRSNKVQPSPEICTILLEYFVSGSQPDLESISALVEDRRSLTRALTDRVFWENVVKHYHRAGALDRALDIVYDLDAWGIWAGLPLLEPLLRSLVYRNDWDGARKLVTTVRNQPRPEAADPSGRYWKYGFWAVANEYGLLR